MTSEPVVVPGLRVCPRTVGTRTTNAQRASLRMIHAPGPSGGGAMRTVVKAARGGAVSASSGTATRSRVAQAALAARPRSVRVARPPAWRARPPPRDDARGPRAQAPTGIASRRIAVMRFGADVGGPHGALDPPGTWTRRKNQRGTDSRPRHGTGRRAAERCTRRGRPTDRHGGRPGAATRHRYDRRSRGLSRTLRPWFSRLPPATIYVAAMVALLAGVATGWDFVPSRSRSSASRWSVGSWLTGLGADAPDRHGAPVRRREPSAGGAHHRKRPLHGRRGRGLRSRG